MPRTVVRRSFLPAVLLLLILAAGAASARTIDVSGDAVGVTNSAGIEYVPLSSVAEAMGGKSWRVNNRFVVVMPGDTTRPELEYVFWADSSVVRCANREILLSLPPVLDEEQLYVPVLSLAAVFPGLAASVPLLRLTDLSEAGDTVLVQFEAASGDSLATYGEVRSSLEYRLVVGARCDSVTCEQLGLIPVLAANGMVQDARLDTSGGTAVHLMFRRPAAVQAVCHSGGVLVRVWPRPERKLQRIVLDPGHGGKDPGAVGALGTLEKTIALDVAQRVKTRLEGQGFEVHMTRSRDEYVPLSSRSAFAAEKKADLFVSIHANASPNKEACGFETYFLSEAKSDWERAVAARENASIKFEEEDTVDPADELGLILADLAQNEYLTESSELAGFIQEQTYPNARIKDRGVRQANFYVLRQNYMPAVLVECGFISNRSEEKLLRNPSHRERVAEGVAAGIGDFVKKYEKRVNGT